MRKLSTWILSLMLVAAMVFGAVAVMAADDPAQPDAGYLAENVQTGMKYTDVSDALQAAFAGQTVKLLHNAEARMLTVKENTTLDLNGYELTAQYASVFGYLEDNSAENTGVLNVAENKLLINAGNKQLPVKIDKGYQFVEVIGFNTVWMNENTFVFQPQLEAAACAMLKDGAAKTGVSIQIEVNWRPNAGSEELGNRTFKYGDTLVTQYINSYNADTDSFSKMFTLTISNAENYKGLTCTAKVISDTGVKFEPVKQPAQLTEDQTLESEQSSALVAAGTKLTDSDVKLELITTELENSSVVVGEGEEARAMDIHVTGLAKDNTVPVIVTINEMAPEFMNRGNIALFHIENGEAIEMTRVYALKDVDVHNEFYYDIETGTVTMAMASFSEVAVVSDTANVWNGEYDYSWYNPVNTEHRIANADQLAAFGRIVGDMASYVNDQGQTVTIPWDEFNGETVTLLADIDLGGYDNLVAGNVFYPIGYYYTEDKNEDGDTGDVYSTVGSFNGMFDGAGHTVSNLCQRTWDMKGDYEGVYYKDAMGLFGYVVGGDPKAGGFQAGVRNLTIRNFFSEGEFTPTGCVAAYAKGNVLFENISLFDCNPCVYNTGNGGIVGWDDGGDDDSANENTFYTFKNITIDNSNKITALWGSWDVSCAGLLGYLGPKSEAYMENCHVAAQIDVYNDVCGNYQYYWYRYAGMMIGTIDRNKVENGYTMPDTTGITAKDCTVHFGDWNNYYYCELVANSLASYTHDHQFSRLTQVDAVDVVNMTVTVNGVTEAISTSGRVNYVVVDGKHAEENATCYHFVNGKVWNHADAGTETVNGEEVLKEDKQHYLLPFNQLFQGYGWGEKCVPIYDDGLTYFEGITILDREPASVEKFESKGVTLVPVGKDIPVGELFKVLTEKNFDLEVNAVRVSVSDPEGVVTGTFTDVANIWSGDKIRFDGIGTCYVTIQDYYFCEPTVIEVTTVDKGKTEACPVCNKTVDWYEWDGKTRFLSGHYYLTKDLTIDTLGKVYQNTNVCLDLCGHNLTGTDKLVRFFDVDGTFNLMDSAETDGTITSVYSNTKDVDEAKGGVFVVYKEGAMNIYGGNLVATGKLYQASIGRVRGGKLNVYGGTMTGKETTGYGGILRLGSGSEVHIAGGTINGCEAKGAGAIYLYKDAVLTITGGVINGGNVSELGGAIYCEFGTLILDGGTVTGGHTNRHGANIAVLGGVFEMKSGAVSNGTATLRGGNIYVADGTNKDENNKKYIGSFKFSGGTITGGQAPAGSNVYTTIDTEITLTGTVNMDGALLNGKLLIDNMNKASAIHFTRTQGAYGVFATSARAQELEGCFSTNENVYQITRNGNDLEFSLIPHVHCVCGGAAENVGDHSKCEEEQWIPISEALAVNGLYPDAAKLDVLPDGNYYLDVDLVTKENFKIGTATVKKYIKICLNGHNIESVGTSHKTLGYLNNESKLDLCDCSYKDGKFGGTVKGGSSVHGALIYTYWGTELRVFGGNYTRGTEDVAEGFGLFVIAMDNGQQGGIGSEPSVLKLYNGHIYGGKSLYGANLSLLHSSVGYIYGGVIEDGIAVQIDKDSTKNSKTLGCGGNVYVGPNCDMFISGGVIRNGYAQGNPVMEEKPEDANFPLGYVTGTSHYGSGGNIFCEGTLEISGGQIYDGLADGNHGGNIFYFDDAVVDHFTISGGQIWGGKANADGSVGGSAELAYGYNVSGGSIRVEKGHFEMTGGTIGINAEGEPAGGEVTTGGEGGNLALSSGRVLISGGVIANGQAAKGGNIEAFGGLIIEGDVVIKDGIATNVGGNISLYGVDPMTDHDGTMTPGAVIRGNALITGGKAEQGGGNITFNSSTLEDTVHHLYIYGNARIENGLVTTTSEKNGKGGNILGELSRNNLYITGGTVTGGTAASYGGNIWCAGLVQLSDCTITNGVQKKGQNNNIYIPENGMLELGGTVQATDVFCYGTGKITILDSFNAKSAVTVTQSAAGLLATAGSDAVASTALGSMTAIDPYMEIVRKGATLLMQEIHQTHCVCGGSAIDVEDHECADIEWQALRGIHNLSTLASGNYYLIEDLTITGSGNIDSGKQITICLNGYDILATDTTARMIGVLCAGVKLQICDCSGVKDADGNWTWQGDIRANASATDSGYYGGVMNIRAGAQVNVFGGNFYGAVKNCLSGGIFNVCNDSYSSVPGYSSAEGNSDYWNAKDLGTALNIYNGYFQGGTVTANKENKHGTGAIINTWHNVAVNIYGGTLVGGTARVGGVLVVSSQSRLVMKNCTVTGGTATESHDWFSLISGTGAKTMEGVIIGGNSPGEHGTYLVMDGTRVVKCCTTYELATEGAGDYQIVCYE